MPAPIACGEARPLAERDPGEQHGDEGLQLDHQRGEPDRHALPDREEQQAELADADQQPVEDHQQGPRARRLDKQQRGKGGEDEAQRGEHQRRRLAHPELDRDEGEAERGRGEDRRQEVAWRHGGSRCGGKNPSPACGRRWREAPDEGP